VHRADLVIVTPALAAANNGNWQTAQRWARMLRPDYRVRLVSHWEDGDEQLMLALHARRSAAAVQTWRARHPTRALAVVLTGTDLYGDLAHDSVAQRSLDLADRLIVLNQLGLESLLPRWRAKALVSLQSSPARQTLNKPRRHLRALMVGHLREEKMPQTFQDAAQLLRSRSDILFDHIGAALDPTLADTARHCMADHARYRWLGALPHGATRRHIQQAHVLVHSSRIEGGAHVVIEALTSGTPVLASRIPGNVGLLGADYDGCFECGDARGLAGLLERCRDDPAMLTHLRSQCARRAPLFTPERERTLLRQWVADLLETKP
jgi:putative glycosyltransferase (TIGR04348 family)